MPTPTKPKLKNRIDETGHFICNGNGCQVSLGIVINGYVYCRKCAKNLNKN